MSKITIHNVETGKIIEREMTADELAQQVIDQTNAKDRAEAETVKAAEKAALLSKLGITADEAALLLA